MARISFESAVFYALIGITAHSGWNASSAAPATPVQLAASPAQAFAGTSSINNIRIGLHPGKMRIVLDISQPTEMGFEASDDGKSVIVKLPASVWRAGAFSARHARGMLTDFLYTPSESGGGQLSLLMNRPVRIERPFLVPPGGKRGHRMVIDIAPASAKAATAPEKNRHQKNRHPAIRPAVFQSRPAPGQTASSPNSRPHQLVGLWTDANQQLPPETVQLAALETAQTRFPPPRRPYPAPPGAGTYQQPGQAPGQPAPGAMPGQLPAQTYPGQAPAGTFPRQAPAQTFPGQVPARTFPGQVPTQTFPGQVPASVIPPQQPVRSLDQASEMIEKLFYVRGLFGGIFARESDLSGSGNNNTTEFDAGFSLSGAVGADMKNNFRAEAEFIYTNSSVKSIAGTANSTTLNTGNVTGSLITYSGMGNLVYEIPQQSLFTPFVFAGAGVTGLFLDGVNNSGQALYNDSDFVFAMQFGAGVSMPFDDRITLEASYRFFNTFDAELADASGDPTTVEFSSHNFLFGARYAF